MLSNKKPLGKHGESLPESGNSVAIATSIPATGQTASDIINEPCPICQEKFFDQKMVFQCGHFVCCKCEYPKSCLLFYLQLVLLCYFS